MTNSDLESPFHLDPLEYELETQEDGTRTASNPMMKVVVLPDGESKLFKRRALKIGSAGNEWKTCLVAELNGVRVYINEHSQIVVTTQDLKL